MPADRDNGYGQYGGRWPAIVREYDKVKRLCRVEIPGLTDGCEVFPWAEIEYPIGDKSRGSEYATEIEILPDDAVWVAFVGADSRNPIITGWRLPREDNDVDWRRWHHKNVEIVADETIIIRVGSTTITLTPETLKAVSGRIDLN